MDICWRSLESNSNLACPVTDPAIKMEYLALLGVNEDFLKNLPVWWRSGDPASSHTVHCINPFMSANPTPWCQHKQAVNLFLKEFECPKTVTEVLKFKLMIYMKKTWTGKIFFCHFPHQHLTCAFRIKVWKIVTYSTSRHTPWQKARGGKKAW